MKKSIIVSWPNSITEKLIRDKLGAFLGDNNDAKLLSEVAHCIDTPPSLHGFITALENFRQVIPFIIDHLDLNDAAIYSERMRAIDLLLKRINPEEIDVDLLSKNHRHFCASNPLYALLLRVSAFNIRQNLCEQFVAQFYLNYMELWAESSESIRERAGLAMRSTSEGRGFNSTAFDEFQQMLDPSGENILIESLENFETQYGSPSLATNKGVIQPASKQYIRTLILLFTGKLGKKKGGGGTRKGSGSRLADLPDNQNIPTSLANTLDEDETGQGNVRVYHEIGQKQRDASITLGTAPGDVTSGAEAVTEEVSPNKPIAIATDKKRMKLRSVQIANAIAISNQFLPTQWRQLNIYDIHILVKELMLLTDRDDAENNIPSPLLAASIASSLVRGMPMNCITQMKLVMKMIKGGDNHVLLQRKGNHWNAKWLISGSLAGVTGRKSNLFMAGFCRPIDENKTIVLDAPAWVAHLLGKAKVKRDMLNLANRQRMLFPDTCGDYLSAAKKWLKKVRRKYPACRLTLNRIECYFIQCCMQSAKFDLAETAYCHSRVHIIQETQLYYTAVAKERISYIYNQVWVQIDNLIQKEFLAIEYTPPYTASSQQISIGDYRNSSAYLGSEITPTSKAVSGLVYFLQKRIDQAEKKVVPHWEKTVAYHNAYTTYTMLFLAYASGYRAAQDPFPDPRLLDVKTGFMVISDKDFDDSYCTRIIWLPPECVQQMKYYQAHVENIVDHLCLIHKQSFDNIYASFDGRRKMPNRPKGKKRMDINAFEFPPFLFYLDDAGECYSVSPKELKKSIHEIFPFPINANRHFLRTELVERRCPQDILDAFMGHWQRGREPWGQFSSLSPRGYASGIGSMIKSLIRENGWKAIKSVQI